MYLFCNDELCVQYNKFKWADLAISFFKNLWGARLNTVTECLMVNNVPLFFAEVVTDTSLSDNIVMKILSLLNTFGTYTSASDLTQSLLTLVQQDVSPEIKSRAVRSAGAHMARMPCAHSCVQLLLLDRYRVDEDVDMT